MFQEGRTLPCIMVNNSFVFIDGRIYVQSGNAILFAYPWIALLRSMAPKNPVRKSIFTCSWMSAISRMSAVLLHSNWSCYGCGRLTNDRRCRRTPNFPNSKYLSATSCLLSSLFTICSSSWVSWSILKRCHLDEQYSGGPACMAFPFLVRRDAEVSDTIKVWHLLISLVLRGWLNDRT